MLAQPGSDCSGYMPWLTFTIDSNDRDAFETTAAYISIHSSYFVLLRYTVRNCRDVGRTCLRSAKHLSLGNTMLGPSSDPGTNCVSPTHH